MSARTVLVIDDEVSIQASLKGALTDEGYKVLTASSAMEGIELMRAENPDVILLDIWMTEMDGITALKTIREERPDQVVIMMSGHGTIETAVKATKLGAYDFAEKPLSLERILVLIKNAGQAHDLLRENRALKKQVSKHKTLLGVSPAMKTLQGLIARVGPTTGSVLITGENGTGKELVAHSLHAASPRAAKSFVEVNCAAIPEDLIESELFGHEKGAFTGATQLRRGKFDMAHNGTLFLDEIGDMSLKTQAKVLRILQEQKFERVGGSQTISVDVRIVAATNKDIKAEIQGGRFREDLFYRLNVIPFHVQPLRERREDIPILAEHFLSEFSSAHGKSNRALTPEGHNVLTNYPWPGNVRELKNLIERLIILTTEAEDGQPITAAHLLSHLKDEAADAAVAQLPGSAATDVSRAGRNLKDARQEFEKEFIIRTLEAHDWNISKTASILGIERSHLHRKIKSYGIDVK
ncbi:MAG: sigma-54-dependent transcriptional regulator [Bacteriovoracia bacterium]